MIRFLTLTFFLAITSTFTSCSSIGTKQEFYELRVYKSTSAENQKVILDYIKNAYKPGLEKMGLDRIGVFVNAKSDAGQTTAVYMLIPFHSACQYVNRSDMLFADHRIH